MHVSQSRRGCVRGNRGLGVRERDRCQEGALPSARGHSRVTGGTGRLRWVASSGTKVAGRRVGRGSFIPAPKRNCLLLSGVGFFFGPPQDIYLVSHHDS